MGELFLRMITRTFRLSQDFDKILEDESESHGLTVSGLLNQIVRRYVMLSRFDETSPILNLSYNIFLPMLKILPEKEFIEIGEKAGAILPEEEILQHGRRLDLDSIVWMIDTVYGRYGNWFNSNQSFVDGTEIFHLTHQFDLKWSKFLEAYMKSMFQEILNIQPKIQTRPNSVTIYLKTITNSNNLKRIIK